MSTRLLQKGDSVLNLNPIEIKIAIPARQMLVLNFCASSW